MIKLLTSVYFHFSISELNFILTVIKNLLVEISLISVLFFKKSIAMKSVQGGV